MGDARNHHYVPQCYLRNFTANGGKNSKLFAVDLLRRRHFWTTPRDVGSWRDFNRIASKEAGHNALEEALGRFEMEAAKALAKVIEDRSFENQSAKIYVLNLASLIAARNPHMRGTLEEFQTRTFEIVLDMLVSSRAMWEAQVAQMKAADPAFAAKPEVPYERIQRFVANREYEIGYPHGYHTTLEFEAQDTILRTFQARNWAVLKAADGAEFIASDLPVTLLSTSPRF